MEKAGLTIDQNYREYKEQDIKLSKKHYALLKARKNLRKITNNAHENRLLLQDTLNVKLRYEAIIQKLLENDINGKSLPIREIIRTTKATKTVEMSK